MADGYITIETKLSTNKFDKQIVNLEKKIKDEENYKEVKYTEEEERSINNFYKQVGINRKEE